MHTVNVAELRSHLSSYLQRVRQGEEIVIRDRQVAIAKIVPLGRGDEFEERIRRLAARGLVRLPEKRLNLKPFFALPAPRIPLDKLKAALEAEREED